VPKAVSRLTTKTLNQCYCWRWLFRDELIALRKNCTSVNMNFSLTQRNGVEWVLCQLPNNHSHYECLFYMIATQLWIIRQCALLWNCLFKSCRQSFFTTRAFPKSAPANASRLIANDAGDLAINDQNRLQAPYKHYHINGRILILDLHRAQPISIEARCPNDI